LIFDGSGAVDFAPNAEPLLHLGLILPQIPDAV
jgi:hypothetical protein